MAHYIRRRLLLSLFVLLGVSFVASAMVYVSGDPISILLSGTITTDEDRERLRHQLGFDKPFVLQYLDFVVGAVRGDLGTSLRFNDPALTIVGERLPATIQLTVAALLFAVAIAVPVGVLSATRPRTLPDYLGRLLTLSGQSIPLFWLGTMLIMLFAVLLHWLPAGGKLEPSSIILPSITLGLYPMAQIARTLRASVLEVMSREYMLTARGKGLGEATVILRHALRNASLPVVTVIGLQVGSLLGGAVVTETIFGWPGVGLLSYQAIGWRDIILIRAIVTVVAFMLVLVNLFTDVLYAYLDPRIRYT